MASVNCPHRAECNGSFQLRIPKGAAEETLRLYSPSAWAALRKTQIPKPLTGAETAQLRLQSDITGLSTVDVRRLLADNERLRQLVETEHPVPRELGARAGRGPTRADAQRPLTEKELADFERVAIESSFAMISMRLVAEIRRLRQLVIDAEPYVLDTEQTRKVDLPARLKAEVDRD